MTAARTSSDSMMLVKLIRHLRKPFDANVEPGHRVLILTDTAHDALVWQAAAGIVDELDAEPVVAMFPPRPVDYFDPPEVVCQAMLNADINVFLTSTALFHSESAHAAMSRGIPSLVMDGGMTADMFTRGAVAADYGEIAQLKAQVAVDVFGESARQVHVTSSAGTDISYSVEGRIFIPPTPADDYDPFKAYRRSTEGRTTSPLFGCLFPSGEFNVPPVEGSANGRLVIDTSMHFVGLLVEPICLDIRNGRIVRIDGGFQARLLEDYLEEYGDENAYMMPTEASIGINRLARITGIQREDKNFFGSMHFGLGTNADVGGTVVSRMHMDGVVLQPTVTVDGVEKIRKGRFLSRIAPGVEDDAPRQEAGE